jgi:hypothetical protein
MEPQAFSVDTTQTEQVPFDVGVENASPNSSPETIESRTRKFKYGLGDLLGKTQEEIYGAISQGGERELRDMAAAEIDKRKYDSIQKLLVEVANRKQAPLSDEEKDGLASIVMEMNSKTDPNSVLETSYGKQFIAQLERTAAGSKGNNVLDQAIMEDPEAVAKIMNDHSSVIAKNQVLNTILEDAKDRYKSQGWFGWGVDLTKSAIPGYTDYMIRGNVPEVGIFEGLGRGANMDEQRKFLLRLPIDQMQQRVKAIVDRLGDTDPSMAVKFAEDMKGFSESQQGLENFMFPLEVATTTTAAKAAKATGKFIQKATGRVAVEDVKKAAEDMVKASADPHATKSTIEAASGDLTESAVTRATSNAVADAAGLAPPVKKAVEAVGTVYRADIENIRANPGHLGQDIVNRIVEASNNMYDQIVEGVTKFQKVERLPDVLANETTVRAIVDHIKDTYRGLQNTVLDVSKPYSVDLASKNYFIDFYVGQTDGTYFKSRDVAQNFIDRTGLSGEIGKGADPKYTKNAVEIAKREKYIAETEALIERNKAKLDDRTLSEKQRAQAQEQIDIANEVIADKKNELEAFRAARQVATVEQQGLGYYVKITKPIDETQPAIRNALAQTKETKLPESPISQFFTTWAGKLRTPEEVLSKAERQNRLTVTYTPSEYFDILKDNVKNIQAMSSAAKPFTKAKQKWEEWQRGLVNAQELIDPDAVGPNKKGYFFKNPADMEHYWQQWFHRLPDEQEVAAYFEFKRGMEMDRMFRNMAEYRNQSRVGAETVKLVTKNLDGTDLPSPEFSGVVRKTIPGADDNILILGEKVGEEKVQTMASLGGTRKTIQEEIDKGLGTLIEIYAPEHRPLNGWGNIGDSRIRYVYAPVVEIKPLKWDQIPRRGGGHIQYDHDFYIKQAKIAYDDVGKRHWYEGDTTIMAAMNQGVAGEVAKHLNEIRKFLKDQNVTAAREYSNKNMHVDWDQVQSWFKGGVDENGKRQLPRLSLDEEVRVVPRNSKIIDIDNSLRTRYGNFKDGMKEGSLSRNNRVEFAEERDGYQLLQAELKGTKYNPLYSVTPAQAIDPITTLNRGLERIVRSNFMDDYKTMAVEHWIAQAAPYLEAHTIDEIKSAPFYFFMEGKFLKSAPPEIVAKLQASKYHTQQLTGQPSFTDGLLHSTAQKLSDLAVNAIGPKGQALTPTALLPKLRDPFKLVRSLAFHTKLGLFNIPQFIVQAGNYSNILGIAGYKYASPGTLGAQLHFWTGVNRNPEIINHLDTLASKFHVPGSSRWRPGEFKEAWEELNKTGFGNVNNEIAAIDSLTTSKVVTTAKDTFLEWGTIPFKAGERNARYGAWYTAFKEFRDKNPTGRLTNADRAEILQRADLLNVNMSRASSSAINKGIWSVSTQFYTYQQRLFELFFGTRLTAKERARMFAVNAALYGVPMATGLTGLPAADWIREKAIENHYNIGEDFLKSVFMEGLPAALGAVITGGGDPQKGTFYDVGNRFGTKGFEFFNNLTQSDKGFLDVVGGPAWSILKSTWSQLDGFGYAMISMKNRDGEVFPMTVEDLLDPLKEISSLQNLVFRPLAIANTGRWISKKEGYLADATGWQAVVAATLGLKNQEINDIQIYHKSLKHQAEYEKTIEERFRQEFRRGTLALKDNNPELSKKFFTRAQAWLELGGYREDLYGQLVSKAISDNESVISKLKWDFYLRKAPDAERQSRANDLKIQQQIQDKKAGIQ